MDKWHFDGRWESECLMRHIPRPDDLLLAGRQHVCDVVGEGRHVLGLRRADVRDDPVYRARSLLVVRHLPQHGHPPRIGPRLTVGVSIIPFCIRSASSLIFLRSLSFCFGDRLRYSLNTACVFFFIDCAPHQLPRTLNGAYLPQQGHPPCTGPRLTVLLSNVRVGHAYMGSAG
jgi:hypothetical protein